MNRRQALTHARKILADNNIDDASLEGVVLLKHALGIDRVQLYSDLDTDISPKQEKALNKLLARRIQGEPSAYITGHREFYGLDFKVNRDVLIPRPETELLVEKAIRLAESHKIKTIADIGTGCGAIAVSLAVNLPRVTVYAVDISNEALKVAGDNCRKHNVADRIVLLEGDMLEPLPEPVDMIIANLPYVREADLVNDTGLSYEPPLALDGGKDGLDGIRTTCRQAGDRLCRDGFILLEIGQGQADAVTALLQETYPDSRIEVESDLAGIRRSVSLRLTLSVK
ncbi:MAG: peptide chain release factor N(5)-glutamine methyltransferase [Dehalococcoidales bacterium]|nr:peptide chain release factor N(5)-glutamine methyltransferase [Dehalococcoidales bacterium]